MIFKTLALTGLTLTFALPSALAQQSLLLEKPARVSLGSSYQVYQFKSGKQNSTINLHFEGAVIEQEAEQSETLVQYLPFALSMNVPLDSRDPGAQKDLWMSQIKASLARLYTEAEFGDSKISLDASALGYEHNGIPAVGKTWRLSQIKLIDLDVQFTQQVGDEVKVFVRGKAAVGMNSLNNRDDLDVAMVDNPNYDGIYMRKVTVRPEFYAGLAIADGLRVSLGYKPWNFKNGPEGSGFDYDSEQLRVTYQGLEAEVSLNIGDLLDRDAWRGLTVFGKFNHTRFRVRYTQDIAETPRYTNDVVNTSINSFEVGVRYKFNNLGRSGRRRVTR